MPDALRFLDGIERLCKPWVQGREGTTYCSALHRDTAGDKAPPKRDATLSTAAWER